MSNQQASSQPSTGDAAGSVLAPETTTYTPVVLHLLVDQAAYFNVFSLPNRKTRDITIKGQNGARQIISFNIHEELHRFTVNVQPPSADSPLKAANTVGESFGTFKHR